jgi:hypothetical protein
LSVECDFGFGENINCEIALKMDQNKDARGTNMAALKQAGREETRT